jgi:hypothetical protein
MEWRSGSKWIDLCGAPAGLFIGAQILGVILSDERKRGPQRALGLCSLGCWSEESKEPFGHQ